MRIFITRGGRTLASLRLGQLNGFRRISVPVKGRQLAKGVDGIRVTAERHREAPPRLGPAARLGLSGR